MCHIFTQKKWKFIYFSSYVGDKYITPMENITPIILF